MLESAAVGTGSEIACHDRSQSASEAGHSGVVVALLASVAGLVTLGSIHIIGDLSGLAFVISLFTLICATEARS